MMLKFVSPLLLGKTFFVFERCDPKQAQMLNAKINSRTPTAPCSCLAAVAGHDKSAREFMTSDSLRQSL